MLYIPEWVGNVVVITLGVIIITHLFSLLCRSKRVNSVPMVKHYTAIGTRDVAQGTPVRTLYYSNEGNYRLMD
jgi:hypothetical protein